MKNHRLSLIVIALILALNTCRPVCASFQAYYDYYGLTWSEDSKWLMFHGATRNLYHIPARSWVPCPKTDHVHQESNGRLFVFDDEGLFTRLPGAEEWKRLHHMPILEFWYHPDKKALGVRAAGSEAEDDYLWFSSETGQSIEMKLSEGTETSPIVPPPQEDFLRILLGSMSSPETTETLTLKTDFKRVYRAVFGFDKRLIEWTGNCWIERRKGELVLHSRDGTDRTIRAKHRSSYQELSGEQLWLTEAVISPDETMAALILAENSRDAQPRGSLQVYDLNSGELLIDHPARQVTSPHFGR